MVPCHCALVPVQHIADTVEIPLLLFAPFFDHPREVLLSNVCCLSRRLSELEVALVGLRLAELMLLLGKALNDDVVSLDHPIGALPLPVVLVLEHLFVVDLRSLVNGCFPWNPAFCSDAWRLVAWLQGCSLRTEALLFQCGV